MMKIKVFISQPMAGLTDKEILERREQLIEMTKHWFRDDTLEFIDSFTKSEDIVGRGRIAMLGDSIAMMCDADLAVFARGWDKSAGCKVEHEVCVQYNIRRMYEDGMNPVNHTNESSHVFWR